MSRINTPTNQKLLTNVVLVKLKKCGKRFEIACYKNKVVAWRNGIEKNIEEVLQTETVFTNVSRGEVAKAVDLKKAFDTDDHAKVCLVILAKGEFQLSDKERALQLSSKFTEVASTISTMTINPATQRPYPVSVMEKAMKDAHVSVKPNKSAKQQALEIMKVLKESIPLERVKMKIKITMRQSDVKKCRDTIKALFLTVESEENGVQFELVGLAEPGHYKQLADLVQKHSRGKGMCEVLGVEEIPDTDLFAAVAESRGDSAEA